jgi:hypothetical protein
LSFRACSFIAAHIFSMASNRLLSKRACLLALPARTLLRCSTEYLVGPLENRDFTGVFSIFYRRLRAITTLLNSSA